MLIRDLDPERRELLLGMGFDPNKKLIQLNGYPALHLSANGKKSIKYVHRLVAEHYFRVELSRSLFVHHKDEDRWNFRLTNLQTCTHGEHNGFHRRFGKDNYFFGKKHDAETRAVISAHAKSRSDLYRKADGTFAGARS